MLAYGDRGQGHDCRRGIALRLGLSRHIRSNGIDPRLREGEGNLAILIGYRPGDVSDCTAVQIHQSDLGIGYGHRVVNIGYNFIKSFIHVPCPTDEVAVHRNVHGQFGFRL